MTFAQIPSEQIPWWLDRVLVPVFFTFFGASLGFGFGRLKDWFDDRKALQVFLKAIRMELLRVCEHLRGTLKDATQCRDDIQKGNRRVLHLASAFLTTIYSSQLGRVKDVSNALVIEVIAFYGSLANLERVKSHVTTASIEITTLARDKIGDELVRHYLSALDEVIRRVQILLPAAEELVRKLPH